MIGRKVILFSVALAVLLVIPLVIPKEVHTNQSFNAYLPMVSTGRCNEKAGIAWAHGGAVGGIATDLDRLCAWWYYNSTTATLNCTLMKNEIINGALPMMKDPVGHPIDTNDYLLIAQTCLSDYTGHVLVFNEPDFGVPQTNRPACDAAQRFRAFEESMPNALTVAPNAVQTSYMDAFIVCYEQLYGYKPQPAVWGIHVYITTIPIEEQINDTFAILSYHGYVNPRVWITEMGNGTPSTIKYWVTVANADSRIERFAVFTNRKWPSLDLIDDNTDTLNARGVAYMEVIK